MTRFVGTQSSSCPSRGVFGLPSPIYRPTTDSDSGPTLPPYLSGRRVNDSLRWRGTSRCQTGRSHRARGHSKTSATEFRNGRRRVTSTTTTLFKCRRTVGRSTTESRTPLSRSLWSTTCSRFLPTVLGLSPRPLPPAPDHVVFFRLFPLR